MESFIGWLQANPAWLTFFVGVIVGILVSIKFLR